MRAAVDLHHVWRANRCHVRALSRILPNIQHGKVHRVCSTWRYGGRTFSCCKRAGIYPNPAWVQRGNGSLQGNRHLRKTLLGGSTLGPSFLLCFVFVIRGFLGLLRSVLDAGRHIYTFMLIFCFVFSLRRDAVGSPWAGPDTWARRSFYWSDAYGHHTDPGLWRAF